MERAYVMAAVEIKLDNDKKKAQRIKKGKKR